MNVGKILFPNKYSLVLLLIAESGLLLQARLLWMSVYQYVVVLVLAVILVTLAIDRGSEGFAFFSTLVYGTTTSLMYFVRTGYQVLPSSDSYSQFGFLREMASTAHLTQLSFTSPIVPAIQYSLVSSWPGLQLICLTLADVTGLPLLTVAIDLSIALYVALFIAAYALLKQIMKTWGQKMRNLSSACMAIAISSTFFDLPPDFKYNIPAEVILFCCLIVYFQRGLLGRRVNTWLLIVGTSGIVVIHNLTSLAWVFYTLTILLAYLLVNVNKATLRIPFGRGLNTESAEMAWVSNVAVVVTISTIAWWVFFAIGVTSSFSSAFQYLTVLFSTPETGISPFQASILSLQTPWWILAVVRFRNALFVFLLAVGSLILVVRGRRFNSFLRLALFIALILALGSVVSSHILPEYYGLLLQIPLLSFIVLLPLVLLLNHHQNIGRFLMVAIVGIFLFSSAVSFWGNTYAPTYIFTPNQAPSSIGEHPTTWTVAENYFMSFGTPRCLTTNEEYVTSMSVPVTRWNSISGLWQKLPGVGCVLVEYKGLNASASYVGEVSQTYTGFSYAQFNDYLETHAQQVFSSGGRQGLGFPQMYYYYG